MSVRWRVLNEIKKFRPNFQKIGQTKLLTLAVQNFAKTKIYTRCDSVKNFVAGRATLQKLWLVKRQHNFFQRFFRKQLFFQIYRTPPNWLGSKKNLLYHTQRSIDYLPAKDRPILLTPPKPPGRSQRRRTHMFSHHNACGNSHVDG